MSVSTPLDQIPATIPVIAVLEEAQSVLGQGSASESPYVRWVKEGRKYDLGAVMVTQQPGSISEELLSQGDNWFVFHVLSANDLRAVNRANAHFSSDLLSSLLNEPIPGHCVFWSGVAGRPYPIPLRVVSFERLYPPQGRDEAVQTYAGRLGAGMSMDSQEESEIEVQESLGTGPEHEELDYLNKLKREVFRRVRQDLMLRGALQGRGEVGWGELKRLMARTMQSVLREWSDQLLGEEVDGIAYSWVRPFLEEHFGREDRKEQTSTWTTRDEIGKDGKRRVIVFSEESRRRFLES